MAKPILLVASGILLLCQTLATFATSSRDDDGSSLTPIEKESVEQEEKRFTRNINWNPQSHPSGGETYQPAQSYPSHDPHHQQVPFAQPQPQLGAYSAYQPSPAVQPQYEHSGYQPFPAVQPHADPYPVYQPAPAPQHQAESYPFSHNAPALQPQAESYPFHQQQPVAVSPPQPAFQHASMPLPSHSGYSPYHNNIPSPPRPGQPTVMVRYIPGAVSRRYQCQQKVDCGWKSITLPGRYIYIRIPPAPIIEPYPVRPITPVCPQQQCNNPQRPCYNPAPLIYPPVQPVYPPVHPVYPPVQPVYPPVHPVYPPVQPVYPPVHPVYPPVQPIYHPGHPVYPPVQPDYHPGHPFYPPVQPDYHPGHQFYPPVQPDYPTRPIYPPTPCSGHNQCGSGQQCCYGASSTNMGCYQGAAVTLRSQRHLQFNSTVTSGSHVELMIGDWRDSNVTSFVIDLLLPLKVDLEHDMEVILRIDPELNDSPCDTQDTDCIGQRILSCVAEMWPSVIQPLTVAWSAPNNTSLSLVPLSGPMEEQLEAGLQEPLANTTNDLANHSEEDTRIFDGPAFSGGEAFEEVDPVSSAANARQVRLLSFTACLLQSFGAGVVERKKSALLTAKRCVRAYKLQWPRVRACVAPREQGVARSGRGQDSHYKQPLEITVNGEPAPDLDNLKLALCHALLKAGQAPLLCDLLYDELDQSQEEQGFANTEDGSTDNLSNADRDSPSLGHTDPQGLGRGWSEQRLGFSHGLLRDQSLGGADRGQELFRRQEAYGSQDANRALDAEARSQLGNVEKYGDPTLA